MNIEDDNPEKSKSQLKREVTDLQRLGQKLIALNHEQLDRLNLDEHLLSAIIEAKKITSNNAKRRQLQYIGRLMRDVDAIPIMDYINALEKNRYATSKEFKTLENWRERLINEGKQALTEFLDQYPQCDRQRLRHLIAHAQKDLKQEKNTGGSKQLFRYIRDLQELM